MTAVQRELTVSVGRATSLASAAFSAGFWKGVSGITYTRYCSTYRPESDSKYWLLRRAAGFSDFVSCRSSRTQRHYSLWQIARRSLIELKVFCVGGCISVPPIWDGAIFFETCRLSGPFAFGLRGARLPCW